MRRVCFTLQVRPDRLGEYKERHAAVWPEMLEALADAGWVDYSLFLREDGLLVGYLLTEDFGKASEAVAAAEVAARWEAYMGPLFVGSEHGANGTQKQLLPQVFHLETQLQQIARDHQHPAATRIGDAS